MCQVDHAHQTEDECQSTCNKKIQSSKSESVKKSKNELRHWYSSPRVLRLVSTPVYKWKVWVLVNGIDQISYALFIRFLALVPKKWRHRGDDFLHVYPKVAEVSFDRFLDGSHVFSDDALSNFSVFI